ncbi:MAG: Phosphopantetheine adenylyltransferase [Desulfovibrio sp.]
MVPLTERIAVYPGTFDPLTYGHVSLTRRACGLFDKVIFAVAEETGKDTLFSTEERMLMAQEVFFDRHNVEVRAFSGLTVDFARSCGSSVLIRGMRAISDFDYEMQIALLNRRLSQDVETLFLMTDARWLFISSSSIKTAARLNGNIAGLVPEPVRKRLLEKFGHPYIACDDGTD